MISNKYPQTINLIANMEKAIETRSGLHIKIKNLGDNTIYVSRNSDVEIDGDGVKSIQGGSADILLNIASYVVKESIADYFGTIYVLSTKDCKIEIETTNNSNFNPTILSKGGGSNVGDVTVKDIQQINDKIEVLEEKVENIVTVDGTTAKF